MIWGHGIKLERLNNPVFHNEALPLLIISQSSLDYVTNTFTRCIIKYAHNFVVVLSPVITGLDSSGLFTHILFIPEHGKCLHQLWLMCQLLSGGLTLDWFSKGSVSSFVEILKAWVGNHLFQSDVHIAFDRYRDLSTKSYTRALRSGTVTSANLKTTLPTWVTFKWTANKIQWNHIIKEIFKDQDDLNTTTKTHHLVNAVDNEVLIDVTRGRERPWIMLISLHQEAVIIILTKHAMFCIGYHWSVGAPYISLQGWETWIWDGHDVTNSWRKNHQYSGNNWLAKDHRDPNLSHTCLR